MERRDSALTWSIRHGAQHGHADRVLEDVAQTCRAICRAHLPRASGYELTYARLSGPLDGVTITVARANFRALVSIQNFEAPVGSGRDHNRPMKMRLVARADHVEAEPHESDARELALAQWGVAGCVAASMGAGAVALHVMGLLAVWGCALLMLPAFMGTRLWAAAWQAKQLKRRSLAPSRAERAQSKARSAAIARDMARWARALREFQGQHHTVVARFQLRPFRGLSPARPGDASPGRRAPLPRALPATS